jgi:hypothetical protein
MITYTNSQIPIREARKRWVVEQQWTSSGSSSSAFVEADEPKILGEKHTLQ